MIAFVSHKRWQRMLLVVMRMALELDSHDMLVEVIEVNNHACDEC